MNVKERIAAMRSLMKEKKIDVYYIPNEDDHLSEEYTADYFKCKSYLSGFSGDSGCTVITQDFAGLWTDGRYFTQAEGELKGTGVKLMRMRQPGVPDALQFLIDATPEKGVLGFFGEVVSTANVKMLAAALKQKHASIVLSEDLAGQVWGSERPKMPEEKLFVLEKKYTGEDAKTRIERVREAMRANHADVLVLTALEDPCWMLNIRGNDIACTPVSYAFAIVTVKKVSYYVDSAKLTPEVRKYFKAQGVTVRPYAAVAEDLMGFHDQIIWADLSKLNAYLYAHLDTSNSVLNAKSPIELFRAIKNSTEIRSTKHAHVKDGTAMVKFLYWVKQNVSKGNMTELSAQNKLYALREAEKDYIEPSFETIAAYQENGAMMHYTATEDNYAEVKDRGFLLVDSGGTYKDGSTDITRTIALGGLTAEEKKLYTLVLKGHLDLMAAVFLHGTAGNNLDILARRPMWNLGIDYQCGTGHGVGHVLGVHEGPQSIRNFLPTAARPSHVLEEGMIVTDEPGIYLPHKLGIRIENELLVVKETKNFYGTFLKFEPITYCPYDVDAIDPQYLEQCEVDQLNAYHQMVYEKISPNLAGKEKTWLRKVTRPITK